MLDKLKKKRIEICYDPEYKKLIAKAPRNKYFIDIIKKQKKFYWILIPYNSYFQTELKVGEGNLENILCTIEKNEKV